MLHALQILCTQEHMMRFPNKLSIDFNPLSKIFMSYLKLVAASFILCCALITHSPTQDASILYPFVVTFGDFVKQTLRSGRQSVDQGVRICSTCFNVIRTFFTYNNLEWW